MTPLNKPCQTWLWLHSTFKSPEHVLFKSLDCFVNFTQCNAGFAMWLLRIRHLKYEALNLIPACLWKVHLSYFTCNEGIYILEKMACLIPEIRKWENGHENWNDKNYKQSQACQYKIITEHSNLWFKILKHKSVVWCLNMLIISQY